MKTYSSNLQRAEGREGGRSRGGPQEANMACFYPFSASPSTLLPYADPSGGRVDIFFSEWVTYTPTPPPPTCTHTFQQHTRFYSWMKSINGSSEQVARQWTQRPGQHANPGFPGLCYKKNIVRPSGCPKNKKTLVFPKKDGHDLKTWCWGHLVGCKKKGGEEKNGQIQLLERSEGLCG